MTTSVDIPAVDKLKKNAELHDYLIRRVGKAHLRQRIGVETEHAADRFGQGRTFIHIENWNAAAALIRFFQQGIDSGRAGGFAESDLAGGGAAGRVFNRLLRLSADLYSDVSETGCAASCR